jgi:small subunit ribosomal protein S21
VSDNDNFDFEDDDDRASRFSSRDGYREGGRSYGDRGGAGRGPQPDAAKMSSLEVAVDPNQNIEKAMKILKRKLIKEGLFKELKLRRYYEKPSERKKRKLKESMKKIRKEEARTKKNPYMFS